MDKKKTDNKIDGVGEIERFSLASASLGKTQTQLKTDTYIGYLKEFSDGMGAFMSPCNFDLALTSVMQIEKYGVNKACLPSFCFDKQNVEIKKLAKRVEINSLIGGKDGFITLRGIRADAKESKSAGVKKITVVMPDEVKSVMRIGYFLKKVQGVRRRVKLKTAIAVKTTVYEKTLDVLSNVFTKYDIDGLTVLVERFNQERVASLIKKLYEISNGKRVEIIGGNYTLEQIIALKENGLGTLYGEKVVEILDVLAQKFSVSENFDSK